MNLKPATKIELFPDLANGDGPITISRDPTHSSHQAIVLDDNVVVGHKGYRQVKANHGVIHGRWFYEVEIKTMAANDNVRIGWSMISGHLQGPCGFDKFSYSYRARPGSLFHESRQVDTSTGMFKEGFGQGDFLGIEIYLPAPTPAELDTLTSRKWQPGHPYASGKIDLPLPTTTNSAYIKYYKNGLLLGTAFTPLYLGKYYPAMSLFQNASVHVNFGPIFKFPPPHLVTDLSLHHLQVPPPDSELLSFNQVSAYFGDWTAKDNNRALSFMLMHDGSLCLPCSYISKYA